MNDDGVRHYLHSPADFVRDILHADPTPQQVEILESVRSSTAIAARSGHGIGKTAVEAWIILWFITLHPFAKVPCTAPTGHQLEDILWPEVNYWLQRSEIKRQIAWTKTRLAVIGHDESWFAVPRSANKPENLQGFHARHCLFVVDEASGVEQEIMDVVEGALTNSGARLLMCGNPTRLSGTFYNAFHKDRRLYKTFAFSSIDSPLVSAEYVQRIADKYGAESDVYRVRVLGEFPKGTPDTFIRLDAVEGAIARTVAPSGPWQIGVDPARYGDDSSVIYYRRGFHVFESVSIHGINTVRLTGETARVIKLIREIDPEAGTIVVNVDDTGVGGGVTDQLQELEYELDIEVLPQNFGGSGDDDYDDQAAAMWGNLKELLPELDLPDVPELVGQLTTRKYQVRPNGKIKLERKEDMKKRGLQSPDHGDALALCLWESDPGSIRI
ncbi:MAG: phage terminase large subunit, partial [Dehalococcoidales bacterium]|nr:phage terminase large subunit [Dehalococcoidales bacterium]